MDFVRARAEAARGAGDETTAATYDALGELFERKLWHELTLKVWDLVKPQKVLVKQDNETSSTLTEDYLALLDNFVSKFEARMNQLRYAEILCAIVSNAVVNTGALTAKEGIERLEKCVSEKQARLGNEAVIVIDMEAATLSLDSSLPTVKKKLDAARPIVESLTGTSDTAVFEKFYRASASYYKRAGPPEAFYRTALSLLAYSTQDSQTTEERFILATDMSLAALAGEGVYNFGEVLATPGVLDALDNTSNQWLANLLRIFGRGDVDAFNRHCVDFESEVSKQPALVAKFDFLKEKIAILALMNLLFETPSKARAIPFHAVAARCHLKLDQVEFLAMRAMALGLVRGYIDQVHAYIHFDWVQPRVLDQTQIKHLVDQLDALSDKSSQALNLLSDHTVDLL